MDKTKLIKTSKTILYVFIPALFFSGIVALYFTSFSILAKIDLLYIAFYIFLFTSFGLLIETALLKLLIYTFKLSKEKQILALILAICFQLIFFKYGMNFISARIINRYKYAIALGVILLTLLLSSLIIGIAKKYLRPFNNITKIPLKKMAFVLLGIFILLGIVKTIKVNSKNQTDALNRKNVVVITVDSLRFDYLGCLDGKTITPNTDKLFKDGIIFDNFYVHAPYTWSSLSSMMTSLDLPIHNVRKNGQVLDDKFLTIAEILSDHDYVCYVPGDLNFRIMGLHQGFKADLPLLSKKLIPLFHKITSLIECVFARRLGKYGFALNSSLDSTLKAVKFLQKNRSKNFFLWVHYYSDPHVPYYAPEYYKKMYNKGKKSWVTGSTEILNALNGEPDYKDFIRDKTLSDDDLVFLTNLYRAEITTADCQIGMIVKTLKKYGLFSNTMIIITADHGEDFNDRNHFLHSNNLYDTLINVPLIVKLPTFDKHKKITNLARGIDISPTILQYLEIKIPDQFHGQSLLNYINDDKTQTDNWCYSETLTYGRNYPYDKFGLSYTSSKYKYICLPTEGKEELYHLETDKYETNNLADQRKDVISDIKKQIEFYFNIKNISQLVPKEEIKIEKKQLEMLKTLGYVQ